MFQGTLPHKAINIIGNIVKLLVKKILTMEMEVTDSSMQEERAEQDDNTAVKSGDNDSK